MALEISRIILFTGNMAGMLDFYRDVIGLPVLTGEAGWAELGGGGCTIALHEWNGQAAEGPAKIVFHAEDVAAAREELSERGAAMGKIVRFGEIALCDGQDPDGNWFQISSRQKAA